MFTPTARGRWKRRAAGHELDQATAVAFVEPARLSGAFHQAQPAPSCAPGRTSRVVEQHDDPARAVPAQLARELGDTQVAVVT